MKIKLFLLFMIWPLLSFGQIILFVPPIKMNAGHLVDYEVYTTMRKMGLSYYPYKAFRGSDSTWIYNLYPRVELKGNQIIKAKNHDFKILLLLDNDFTQMDSIAAKSVYPAYNRYCVNASHLEHIEDDLQATLLKSPKEIRSLMKTYVHYYPEDYAIKAFNADTLISYEVDWHDWHAKKIGMLGYAKCKVVLAQKNGRGFFVLYCCYNRDEEFDLYFEEFGKLIRFD